MMVETSSKLTELGSDEPSCVLSRPLKGHGPAEPHCTSSGMDHKYEIYVL